MISVSVTYGPMVGNVYIYIIFLRHGIYINDMYYYVCMVCNLSLMSDINVYNEI